MVGDWTRRICATKRFQERMLRAPEFYDAHPLNSSQYSFGGGGGGGVLVDQISMPRISRSRAETNSLLSVHFNKPRFIRWSEAILVNLRIDLAFRNATLAA
jgi:hypothetical protein